MMWSISVLIAFCTVLGFGYPEQGAKINCGPSEEAACVQDCPPEKTCKNYDIQFACLLWYKPCVTKCVCKNGHVRNENGACIPLEKCPQNPNREKRAVCGRNERPSCELPSCLNENSCRNRDELIFCPVVLKDCTYRCTCEKGYFRNSGGLCVTREQCV